MRIANGVLAVVLLAFAAVQYNDPDAAFWIVVYGIGAVWTLLAALLPRALELKPLSMLLSFTVAIALLGVIYFWPDTPGWWRSDVWWETETAREGMGMMIVALSLLLPVITSIRVGNDRRRAERRKKEEAIEARRRSILSGGTALDA